MCFSVDLPVILSGKWLCFMDPQKRIWKGDPGHKYKLTSRDLRSSDLCSPFRFNDPCSLHGSYYSGTMIRLPLRNELSDMSEKLYSVETLKSLLDALKSDAEVLLLFLRYIEQIEVHFINARGKVSRVFCVEAEKAYRDHTRQIKQGFFHDITCYHANFRSSVTFPQVKYRIDINIHDTEFRVPKRSNWFVMHQVGSADKEIMDASVKMCNLPWVGLALPLTPQCSSRLFCFLPLPDSKEVNPPLPVCVHGTFGLNKDRRRLKWITSDMKNDDGAIWNKLLLSKMLPSCYENCLLGLLKDHCSSLDEFYSFWPSAAIVDKTNWKVILKPLYSRLIHSRLFWSQNGGWVKLQSCVLVVPDVSACPQVVINVLITCGKTVVRFDDKVWEAVNYIKAYPFTIITPHLVRQILKKNAMSYVDIRREEKLELLKYCLDDDDDDDNAYSDLFDLCLLPVANNTFVAFNKRDTKKKLYICDEEFLESKLLAVKEDILVSLQAENKHLHKKLKRLAETKCTQLRVFTFGMMATILKELQLFKDGYCKRKSGIEMFDINWLISFWKWVQKHPLSHFISVPLVPINYKQTSKAFRIVPLLKKHQSPVLLCDRDESISSEFINAAGKLGCYICCTDDFTFLSHSELDDFVHTLSPHTFLRVLSSRLASTDVNFTNEEADVLQDFLFQYKMKLHNEEYKTALYTLQIFSALQTNELQSILSAQCVLGETNTTILIAESECPKSYIPYLPQTPLVLCCRDVIANRLCSVLPCMCTKFKKSLIISHLILPAIENDELARDDVIKVSSILLEPKEYHSLVNQVDNDLFLDKFQSLKFLPTDEDGELCLPSVVCDPTDPVLQGLYEGLNVFPVPPFAKRHFPVLRELGMKVSATITAKDVITIVQFICQQNNDEDEVKRANKIIEFLSSPTGNKLLSECYNSCPLGQSLRSLQWLPVITTPPKGYPKCLGWKGSSDSHFVFAENLHASSSPEEHKKLPNLIGSQMKILQYEGPLSDNLIASLNISQNVPLDAAIQHFLNLIEHKNEVQDKKLIALIKQLYTFLQKEVDNKQISSSCWQLLSQSKVVQVSDNKFVLPSVVACSFDEKCMTVGKLEPYWYILPSDLQQYRSLFCSIGVKKEITVSDVLSVLKLCESDVTTTPGIVQLIVKKILKWLCHNFDSEELKSLQKYIYVPVKSKDTRQILKPASEVAYLNEDLQWIKDDKEALGNLAQDYFLAHPSVSYDMCCALKLKPLNTMIANSEEFCFEQAGQSEPLTTRLNRILREYKDTSVIQELLQNADDAGATEVAIYYDTREHDSSHLLFPGMANSYGPTLLFYNNAEFIEEDFENIRKIAGQTKLNKPQKIGKFGVGFCSVYHITDVPSFVSGEYFMVFDPTLQCLRKEIKSEYNPGIKINFTQHHLFKNSSQLTPYKGIGGFNPKRKFHGTLFRFPLRQHRSKISSKVYTESQLEGMIDQVRENSSKLMMFLNNVKKISFHKSSDYKFTKQYDIVTHKEWRCDDTNSVAFKMSFTSDIYQPREEWWLIATSSCQAKTDSREEMHRTASVAVKLVGSVDQKFCIEAVKGECFCFLPLNIETGLPVHVSSNFAVMTNRRGIWKSDNASTATKESNWNKLLMETVVVEAYINLLSCLKRMHQCEVTTDYDYHSLWPVRLKDTNPWEFLVTKFYDSILLSSHALFYSKTLGNWMTLEDCTFLSHDILSVQFNRNFWSSLHGVANVLQLPVVHLPSVFWNKLRGKRDFNAQIMNEEQFIDLFYQDNTLEIVSVEDKTAIVTASLITLANKKHSKALPELIRCSKCIPCGPDGKIFKRPQDIIDPKSNISKLYSFKERMFPSDAFLKQNDFIYHTLLKLGMMTTLSWEMIVDRAKLMRRWHMENHERAHNYLTILIDCVVNTLRIHSCPHETRNELQTVAFLPPMPKPKHYPIQWKGDSSDLLCGRDLTKCQAYHINTAYACGSQVAIFDPQPLLATDRLMELLGINKTLKDKDVAKHFAILLDWFHSGTFKDRGGKLKQAAKHITTEVYKYWERQIKNGRFSFESLSCIKGKTCIWNGTEYLHPACVSFDWETNGPFLYCVPSSVMGPSLHPILQYLGVSNEFSIKTLLNTLNQIKELYGENSVPDNFHNLVRIILPKLNKTIPGDCAVFLPDEQFVLRSTNDLKYNDAPWCSLGDEYVFCHGFVERDIAINLGVEPVKNVLLEDLEIANEEDEEDFGQEEKLTQRLNNILRDYPCDVTFLKELLQNADDAGATELFVILDMRQHNSEQVISEQWKDLQGPALLFWNNSSFSDDDFVGIQKIGLGNKRNDDSTIGQYGIGFNVVYHFTDCPSFISNQKLCIMDPHRHFIAHNKRKKAGKMYKDISKIWQRFADMKSSYLQNDLSHFPELKANGTLFRLPLRLTEEMAQHSEISKTFFCLKKLKKDLMDWVTQVSEALLFLQNVRDLRLYVIDGVIDGVFSWRPLHPLIHVNGLRGEQKCIEATGSTAKLVFFEMTLICNGEEKKWLVQHGEGNVENTELNWNHLKPSNMECRPCHGIASPIKAENFIGKSFCFLPLPGETRLPVHIHGHFILHSDRQSIWISRSNDSSFSSSSEVNAIIEWNQHLLEAIAVSYAYFINNCVSMNRTPSLKTTLKKVLDQFYKLFPDFDRCNTEPWLTLTKDVYKALSELNVPVLAKFVKCKNPSGEKRIVHPTATSKMYIVEWYNLHMPGEPDECYFHSPGLGADILNVLASIGMNLIDSPMRICHQMNKVNEMQLSSVSKDSVIKYYIKFSKQIYYGNFLPCDISSTKFNCVDNLAILLDFLMTEEYTFLKRYETCEEFCSLGLLVTADMQLHSLVDGSTIILSASWKVFSKSKHCFIHEDLQQHYHSDSKYILKFNSDKSGHFSCIAAILASNLPLSWHGAKKASLSEMDFQTFKDILKCIANDESFSVHGKQLLNQFSLLPANDGMVYSTTSEILPMGSTVSFLLRSRVQYDDNEKVRRLLTKLHIPLIEHKILGDSLDDIVTQLPSMFNPEDVLNNLYLVENQSIFQTLSKVEMKSLFGVLKLIPYSSSLNREHLSQLPIFTTIDGYLVSLASASEIWIWCNKQVCMTGMEEWINHVPEDVIFLDPAAPWACLKPEAKKLNLHNINKYDVYCRFIFPHFHSFNLNIQREHLKFIKENIYPGCKKAMEDLSGNKKITAFVNTLKSLKCIMDTSGIFHRIESFCDHNEPIFKTFCSESSFLPMDLRGEEWQGFLKYFGLRIAPTAEEYISFCNHLPNIRNIHKIREASLVLLNALFQWSEFEDINIYKDIHSPQCLANISQIPIAVVKENKLLHSIKEQKMGEHIVCCGSDTISLTKLSGSSIASNQYLVWTVLPLVTLPVDFSRSEAKKLGIVLHPLVQTVLSNLENLSTSDFASFSRFERHRGTILSDSSVLPEVPVKMLEYVQRKLKEKGNFNLACSELEPRLSKLKFLPVKLSSSKEYALVRPTQVLCVEPSLVKPYYPFLHPLIEEANSVMSFLSNIGVCRSLKLSHIQYIFESVYDIVGSDEIDANTRCIIVKATKQLIHLLQQVETTEEAKDDELQHLYLLSEQNRLMECSKLFINDVATSQPFQLPAGYAYLNLLTDDGIGQWKMEDLLEHLPKRVGLRSLKSILMYDMLDCTPAEYTYPHISIIQDILLSKEFKIALESYSSCCIHGPTPPIVSDILSKFQTSLDVQYLNTVQVQPKINIDGRIIPLDVVLSKTYFLEKSFDCYTLSLKNDQSSYRRTEFLKLAKQLCSILRLKSTECFTTTEDSELPELTAFVSDMLQCRSISEVVQTIKSYLPGGGIDELESFTTVSEKPTLGNTIPHAFHERLDQNFLNFFNPEEWVGYEIEHEHIVYAQILHEVIQDQIGDDTVQDNMQRMMQRRFLIALGNDKQIEVSVLELYKFLLSKETSMSTKSSSKELKLYDGPTSSKHGKQVKNTGGKKAIKDAVKAAWALPKEQRNKAIKRLYLQYHPDKNPENPSATAEFQYLIQVIERMEGGIPEDEVDGHDRSEWRSQFHQWNQTASSHKRFRSRNAGMPAGGVSGDWNIPNPHKDLNEAKRWIKQAKYDYAALCVLKNASATDNEVSAAACFMSHEVAEKSLKAGMYAKCGLGQVSLNNHDLVLPARQLVQLGCSVNISDAEILEKFYLNTRFPNRYPYPTVPGEKFTNDTAKKAFKAATRIYEAMMQAIENDD